MNPLRHYGGFLLAGIAALITDAAILETLRITLALDPLVARLPSISIAMMVSWLINRTITFAVKQPPTLVEFLKFASVSWIAQAINYAIFASILLASPSTWPLAALIAASLFAMFVSYVGFRLGVFRSK